MSAVVLGSLILIITAANRLGLYSAFLACKAIVLRSSLQTRLTVQTIFLENVQLYMHVTRKLLKLWSHCIGFHLHVYRVRCLWLNSDKASRSGKHWKTLLIIACIINFLELEKNQSNLLKNLENRKIIKKNKFRSKLY